jgi:DNA-binding winged helix-turn-helix (wHTH) protein
MPSNKSHLIKLLDLEIMPHEFKVTRAGCNINLPNLSYELLMFFIENAQQLCTLEEISMAVWRNTVVSNDTIVQRVTLLRKALNDDAKSPKYIESVRSKGYRLLPLPIQIESTHTKGMNQTPLTMITGLIVVGALAIWFLLLKPNLNNSLLLAKENNTVDSFIERGRYYYDIGQTQNLELAKSLYSQALQKSPDNIDALTGLSLVVSKLVCRYNNEISSARQAKSLAEKAISLDKTNSKAHFALAYA